MSIRFSTLLATGLGFLVFSCQPETPPTAGSELLPGASPEALVSAACSSCHLSPDPEDLPRHIWDTIVLPRMAAFMQQAGTLGDGGYSEAEWQSIRRWFLEMAPDSLSIPRLTLTESVLFRPHFTESFLSPPSTSYLAFQADGKLLAADINKKALILHDRALSPLQSLPIGAGVTDMITVDGTTYATVIGSFTPTDEGTGQLVCFGAAGMQVLAEGLQRPTSLLAVNLDADEEPEFVVTEYGQWAGKLSYYDRVTAPGSGKVATRYQPITIVNQTGAIRAVAESDTSFLVLYGQGKESIVRYYVVPSAPADRKFRAEMVRSFPPSYGSSSLAVIDWNKDDYPDLLYTAGDNADYSPIVKPYHGVRIFEGGPLHKYTEALFLPLPGAYEAVMDDFNEDGHPDIAAISFFPDYRQAEPVAAVLFFGPDWQPQRLPADAAGRWLRLAAGDPDGDGDTDLVAGSLTMEPVPDRGRLATWIENGLPFVVWENQLK